MSLGLSIILRGKTQDIGFASRRTIVRLEFLVQCPRDGTWNGWREYAIILLPFDAIESGVGECGSTG